MTSVIERKPRYGRRPRKRHVHPRSVVRKPDVIGAKPGQLCALLSVFGGLGPGPKTASVSRFTSARKGDSANPAKKAAA